MTLKFSILCMQLAIFIFITEHQKKQIPIQARMNYLSDLSKQYSIANPQKIQNKYKRNPSSQFDQLLNKGQQAYQQTFRSIDQFQHEKTSERKESSGIKRQSFQNDRFDIPVQSEAKNQNNPQTSFQNFVDKWMNQQTPGHLGTLFLIIWSITGCLLLHCIFKKCKKKPRIQPKNQEFDRLGKQEIDFEQKIQEEFIENLQQN